MQTKKITSVCVHVPTLAHNQTFQEFQVNTRGRKKVVCKLSVTFIFPNILLKVVYKPRDGR